MYPHGAPTHGYYYVIYYNYVIFTIRLRNYKDPILYPYIFYAPYIQRLLYVPLFSSDSDLNTPNLSTVTDESFSIRKPTSLPNRYVIVIILLRNIFSTMVGV